MSPTIHSDNTLKGITMTREETVGMMAAIQQLVEGNKSTDRNLVYLRTQLDDHIKDGLKVERHKDQRHTDMVVELARNTTEIKAIHHKIDTQGTELNGRMKSLVAGISFGVSLLVAVVTAWANYGS